MKTQRFATELQLLTALKDGLPQAVEYWFKQYRSQVASFLHSKISSDKDAEELTQEVFLNCLKHLPLFRGEAKISTWMLSIARHEVSDYYRKRYAKKAILMLPLNELVQIQQVEDAHEVSEVVKQVFNQLSQEHRELLLLKYIDHKKIKDIAQDWGKSVKSIESELFRARMEFRRLYEMAGSV